MAHRLTKSRDWLDYGFLESRARALRITSMVTGFMPSESNSSGRAQRTSLTSVAAARVPERMAEIVDENVVVLGAAFTVGKDRIEDIEHRADFHIQSSLLANLAGDAIAQLFSEIERASGDRPLALQWRVGAANDEHLAIAQNDGANSNDGTRRIETGHTCKVTRFQSFTGFKVCKVRAEASGEKAARIEVHDLPAFGAALQFEAELTLVSGDAASVARRVFQLEVSEDHATIVLLRSLNDAKGDADGFIAGEVGLDLILKVRKPSILSASKAERRRREE